MSEVFGDPADFAIEAGIEPQLVAPSAVWGHMCVWCRGVALGNLDDRHCGLYHAYESFKWISDRLDDLWAPELETLDTMAAWNFLDGLLYGYHGDVEVPDDRTAEECDVDSQRWGRHNFLTNWGEQFDGCKAFLLAQSQEFLRVLYRRNHESVQCAEVSRRGLLAASDAFTRWFEIEQRRLHDSDEVNRST